MQLRYRQQVAAAGVAVVALALTLGACSSSSSSSSPSGGSSLFLIVGRWLRQPQRHAQRQRIDAPARLPAGGHRGLQVGPVRHHGQLRRRRLGQGTHGPGLGNRQLRGLGLADPRQGDGELQGQDRALLSHSDRPDHGLVQPVRRQQPEAVAGRPSRASSRARSRPGTTRRSRRTTPVSACPAPRSPSPTARTRRAPPPTSPSSSWRPGGAPGRSAPARSSTGPPAAGAAAATPGCRRSSSPPPGPSGTWTTPTPRPRA